MSLFSRTTSNRAAINKLIKKTSDVKKKNPSTKKGVSISDRIKNTCAVVQNKLGHYEQILELINTPEALHEYISHAIQFGKIAIDTETTGLDPITDQIVGACIYTPGRKAAYIPINHISVISQTRLNGQLTNEQVANEFKRLVEAQTKIIYFNAKFDIRVMRHQLGVDLYPYWDGFIAGKCLKENEEEGNLKYLWKKYCSENKDAQHFTFDKLFDGIKFNLIPITTAYLYAAMDAKMTYDLYEFQEPWLDVNNEKCQKADLTRVAKLYREIEMPIISIVADIEDRGVQLNVPYCKELSEKYNKILQENIAEFNTALEPYQDQITGWVNSHPDTKLENPINIGSSTQLAELFYDILKQPAISRKAPRGTGEEILKKMDHPLCAPILKYRGTSKLLTTYIDKMPEILNSKTHRIHCTFKQYGADTGRFASSDPNLQNIPSHNTDIRPMFEATTQSIATYKTDIAKIQFLKDDVIKTMSGEKSSQNLVVDDTIISDTGKYYSVESIELQPDNIEYLVSLVGYNTSDNITVKRQYIMVGADYSQQEPKITADLSNDEKFIAECAAGKDAYGTIASLAFNKSYEECLEFFPDGTVNKEGKERRSQAKSILLGLCYGRTIETIAEQLKCSVEKAQQIKDAVFTGIAGLKNLMTESEEMARQFGFVETKWGRRRHIPDMQLQPFEITSVGTTNFDPFFDSKELGVIDDIEILKRQFVEELTKAKYKQQKDKIIEKAGQAGFKIKENTRKIEDAKRQCVNSRIQGSAADQTKIAMRLIGTNEQLKHMHFHMILLVHDEVIGEVPVVYAKQAVPIFVQCMLDAAKDLRTGAKCDASLVYKWYGKEIDIETL